MRTSLLMFSVLTLLLGTGCSMLESVTAPLRSTNADDFDRRFYAGLGAGVSRVAPDTSASTQFSLDNSMSTAVSLIAGMDFSERIAFEIQATDLGAATLSPPEEVSYSAIGVAGLFYAFGSTDSISQRRGFAGFLRAGVNLMSHESDIELDREDNAQVWLGLGADYFLSSRFALRAELAAQDTDSQSGQLAVLYRFGDNGNQRQAPRVVERAPSVPATPVQSAPPVVIAPAPAPQTAPQTAPRPAATLLGNSVLAGVNFIPGTADLAASSNGVLDALAEEIISNPAIKVELQSHADASLGQSQAMQVSRARVLRIGKYLIGRGVSSSQLGARAFGANRPLGTTPSAADNRIELVIR